MKLYEIAEAFLALDELLDNPEVVEEEVDTIKEVLTYELETKGDNIIRYCRVLESDILTLDEEIKRLQSLKKSKQNKVKKLKDYTMSCLYSMNITKLDTSIGKVSIRNNAPAVVLDDDFDDERFKDEVITITYDKKAIKEAIKNGVEVKGASLVSTPSLTIK